MEIIAKLQNGQTQVAQVTPAEFKELKFKFYDKAPKLSESASYVKVYFNKKEEVVEYDAIQKMENASTSLFKKEVLKKNGTLKKSTIKALNSLAR